MGKDVDMLLTAHVGIPFGGLREHEPLIVVLFISVVTRRDCRGPWTARGSELSVVTVIYLETEYKGVGAACNPSIGGKLRQV